ncbi:hypothetical protein E8P82_12590 [Arthrobacter echini]|uniref:Uncharacterized protein n=1 Tax=Arthrobacter echini TaxID=1529066 RepID=A0A4S5E1C1_9MICC|nr:hypothetical protein [Arthrobacter echini]THJ65145.1 hypothetical protein E8P82_12590 [Arthrobacter echini]
MEYVAVLLPSAVLAVLFYFVIRAIFNADRSEREAMRHAEMMQDEQEARDRASGRDNNDGGRMDPDKNGRL